MPEKLAYKRLETDAEFSERILNHIGRSSYKKSWIYGMSGIILEDTAWVHWDMQRRIIEVFP